MGKDAQSKQSSLLHSSSGDQSNLVHQYGVHAGREYEGVIVAQPLEPVGGNGRAPTGQRPLGDHHPHPLVVAIPEHLDVELGQVHGLDR